jgi:prepilin-type N-terminal cleavage/methylation domain-containing protein
MRRRTGFTLIEVMIVVAVTVILLGAVFAINFRITDMWRSERVRQALQQNFRFAADMMTTNLRQATNVSLPAQNSNALGDVLEFDYVVTLSPSETRHRVVYQRVGSGPYHIERREVSLQSSSNAGVTTWQVPTGAVWSLVPVTEDISSLAALHFIRRGSRVVMILVANYESGGAMHTISYTLQTSIRALDPRT